MATKNAPIHNFKAGANELSIWENKHDGFTTYSVSLHKNWKDEKGEWQKGHSYNANDLPLIELLCRNAFEILKLREYKEVDNQ